MISIHDYKNAAYPAMVTQLIYLKNTLEPYLSSGRLSKEAFDQAAQHAVFAGLQSAYATTTGVSAAEVNKRQAISLFESFAGSKQLTTGADVFQQVATGLSLPNVALTSIAAFASSAPPTAPRLFSARGIRDDVLDHSGIDRHVPTAGSIQPSTSSTAMKMPGGAIQQVAAALPQIPPVSAGGGAASTNRLSRQLVASVEGISSQNTVSRHGEP